MILLSKPLENQTQLAPENSNPVMQLTRIFRFETAHASHRYEGKCNDVHDHSYELHVTIADESEGGYYLPGLDFTMDFKELKSIVSQSVVDVFDHKVILSHDYTGENPQLDLLVNLVTWNNEPSAETMLVYIRKSIENKLPGDIRLMGLKLSETADSYAEWLCC